MFGQITLGISRLIMVPGHPVSGRTAIAAWTQLHIILPLFPENQKVPLT
jgi:hypothetical protein